MIKRIFSGIKERLSDDYYGNKIRFFYMAYGAEYDFCRFYSADSGTVLIYNSNAVIDAAPDDEVIGFIEMISPDTAEMSRKADITGMNRIPCEFMIKKRTENPLNSVFPDIIKNGNYKNAFDILEKSFGYADFGLWYTHISHCVRRGMADVLLIENSASARMEYFGDFGYISDVSVVPDKRGQGFCRRIMNAAEGLVFEKCGTAAVCAADENVPLYEHLGYEKISCGYYFEKKL